jgi:aspartyl-tRNA(Asn)/glutamyl-tRNA(Gln) amidotransferase subunit A
MRIGRDVLYGTVVDLGRGLREGAFSSEELAEAYLERLEDVGPRLNALATVTRTRAIHAARRADEELAAGRDRGPLHGIPYGVKDLIAVRGHPTTWGAKPYKHQTFDEDATVVRLLDKAGAVLTAKLASVELAGGMGYEQANASLTGPGLNPWNTRAWSGGSSSGPGSAVAAGLIGFAIGSETWGSIVTPSSFCGVSGLRPTYGRVSRAGAMALSWTMDKLGPMCRSAEDCWLVLSAIAGKDDRDPSSADHDLTDSLHVKGGRPSSPRRPRLAVLKGSGEREQPGVRDNFARSIALLAEYSEIEEVELPDLPYGPVAGTIIRAEAAAAFEELVESGRVAELTAPEDRIKPYAGQMVLAKDYINAQRVRVKIQAALDEALRGFDAMVGPTRTSVANPIEARFSEYFGEFDGPSIGGGANAAGIPGITVPNGFGERGLPTGLQFTVRAWDEAAAIGLAMEYQRRTDWHLRHPEI